VVSLQTGERTNKSSKPHIQDKDDAGIPDRKKKVLFSGCAPVFRSQITKLA
jgi:hypothetical protein